MGLFSFLSRPATDDGVREFQNTKGAVLLDVRTKEEYAEGHIERGVNIPLDRLNAVAEVVPDRSAPLFVYCAGGARSERAVQALKAMGYTEVKNIGGIANYRGKVVR